jgi:hypothetical protein
MLVARWLVLAVVLVLTASRAHAAGRKFYVDSARGRDANSGDAAGRAWQTLGPVNAATFGPGDEILVRAGSHFRGQLSLRGSGTAEAPIVLRQYGSGPRPRIDGEGTAPETVRLHNSEYWEVRDLEITNTGAARAPHRAGVVVSLEDFGTAHGIVLSNLYVHDVNSTNVKEGGGAGIAWWNRGGRVKSRFDGLLIEDCHLVRTDRNGIVGWSEYWARDNWYPSLHVVIRNNRLEDIGGDGIVPIGCDGCLVEHNVLDGGRRRAEDYAAGIWPWSCDNMVVQCNEVSHMRGTLDGQGFDADWNCRNTLIQYNYSHDNEGGFLLICNDGSQGAPSSVGNIGTVVRYNLSENDGARAFQISAVKHTRIYNNTIYVAPGHNVLGVHFSDWNGHAEDTEFVNNIFYAAGRMRYDPGQAKGTVFRRNVWYGEHESRPDDPTAITADPQLVRPGKGRDGYRPGAGSPCRGAGEVTANNGGRDFLGKTVPSGAAPSIGACQ